ERRATGNEGDYAALRPEGLTLEHRAEGEGPQAYPGQPGRVQAKGRHRDIGAETREAASASKRSDLWNHHARSWLDGPPGGLAAARYFGREVTRNRQKD